MQVILGTKIGMTQIIGEDGVVTPVTILQAGPCAVTQIKTVDTDGYSRLLAMLKRLVKILILKS